MDAPDPNSAPHGLDQFAIPKDGDPRPAFPMLMFPASEPNREKQRIAERLGDFDAKRCPVWRKITQRFGNAIKQPELLSIARVLADQLNLKLDRDAKRRKSVLIKWFAENWELVGDLIDYVQLEDAPGTGNVN